MKLLNYFSITACALSLGLCSCSEDEEETTNTAPSLPEMGITSPVTSIYENGSPKSLFTYKDGKLVGGESEEFGKFSIGYTPLKIAISNSEEEEGYSDSSKGEIYNIKTNAQGFITSFNVSTVIKYEESDMGSTEKGNGTIKGTGTVEYTAEGYIKKLNINSTLNITYTYVENGNTETVKETESNKEIITYTWKNGNLDSLSCAYEWIEGNEEPEKKLSSFGFTYDTTTANNGIYHWDEICSNDGISSYDIFFYGGFLGKPTKNLPIEVRKYTSYNDNRVLPVTTTVENNKITNLNCGYMNYTYQYNGNKPQNQRFAKRVTKKMSTLNRSNQK